MTNLGQEARLEAALVSLGEAWAHLSRRIAADVKEYPFTLPPAQVNLLQLLERLGPQRMSTLAAHLDVTLGGCTTIVDRVLQTGYLERYRDPEDRRVVWVTLTEEGIQVLSELRRVRAKILAKYLSRLEPTEIETLAALLSHAVEVMLAEEQASEPVLALG